MRVSGAGDEGGVAREIDTGIVAAQVFVCCPFLVKTAMTAFEGVPSELEGAARTLGATAGSAFFRIALPLASRGILVGAVLSWSRAIWLEFFTNQSLENLLLGHVHAFNDFGGVPRHIL